MAQARRLLPSMSQLAAFEAVCRTGSTLAAAADLSLTQGAVSKLIQTLEAQLGVPLFLREGRRLLPSAAAESFARDVARALDLVSRGAQRVRSTSAGGTLALAVLPGFGTRWLAPRLPAFLAANPGITINMGTRLEPFDLEAEGFDAAIHFGRESWPDAVHLKLFDEALVVVAAPGRVAGLSLAGLAGQPLLQLETRPAAWRDWFAGQGHQGALPQGMLFDQFAPMIEAAVHGLGLALVPEFLVRQELAEGRLAAWGPPQPGKGAYWLVWPKGRDWYPPLQAFRGWLERM
jgi:DNA-binding transcriptional LysR family regulator